MRAPDRDIAIHVSDSSLMHLLLAGLEAYKMRVRRGSDANRKLPLETGGLLWGFIKDGVGGMDHVTVEHISVDTAANRQTDSVALCKHSTVVKRRIIEDRWPNLSLIGDFHTHPYKSLAEVKHEKGWEPSACDIAFYEKCDEERDSWVWDARVFLILTLAEQHSKDSSSAAPRVTKRYGNILRWQQGGYRFWLSAYAVDRTNGGLAVSPKPAIEQPRRRYVYIDVPTVNGTSSWFSYGSETE
ncbi:MAG: hypothetical protein OXI79_10585 [Gammaproteobacteria bacterium]|nr:hypothetical protein [Gammaproteobacteria bacterium]